MGVLHKGIAASPRPGTLTDVNAGLTARPRPALSTRIKAITRLGSESARRRAMSIQKLGDKACKEGRRVVDGGSGTVRGARQVRSINPVSGSQIGQHPLPVESVVAGSV